MVTHPVMESCEIPKTALPNGTDAGSGEHTGLLGVAPYCKPEDFTLAGDAGTGTTTYSALLNANGLYKKGGGIVSAAFSDEDRSNSGSMPPREGSEVTLQLDEDAEEKDEYRQESLRSIILQVFFPFMCAGVGTVLAGLVLHHVQDLEVFKKIPELMVLVPALLGLKGNLEMTLAARLSTQANLGNMDSGRETWRMVYGNLVLVQCQAAVVAFLASVFAIVVEAIPANRFILSHAALLCASSLLTAALASVLLGCVTAGIVIGARKCHVNPDNVATPVAASLGDVTTLALQAAIGSFLYDRRDAIWLPLLLGSVCLLLAPLWAILAHRNPYTREVLFSGWIPVIGAAAISSFGGLILDKAVAKFHGLAAFNPVINGVGGNLAAVQASRISTYLHQRCSPGHLPAAVDDKSCISPFAAFFGRQHAPIARVARTLLLMALPGHLIFAYLIRLLNAEVRLSPLFLLIYEASSLLQVLVLLYSAHVMIYWMWKHSMEPDNSSIPYLTAMGDLLGTALLALAFLLLEACGDPIAVPSSSLSSPVLTSLPPDIVTTTLLPVTALM